MTHETRDVLGPLDEEQRAAVLAPAGPVCVLAGAGTGKTRAITHRIAARVLSGEIAGRNVLAVTFTARAAGEMRGRLRQLGVAGVSARTFHSAALRQLKFFAPRVLNGKEMPRLLEQKVRTVAQAAAILRLTLDKTTLRDVTSEIEWAKSSLIEPDDYATAAVKHQRAMPIPGDQLTAIYGGYEVAKRRAGVIDFEDMLRATIWAIEEHRDVADQIRAQYRHFVVDEYQDVNPLQQRLLDAWLGGRRDVCVVGDASQTIYSFTGASASYLADFPRRYAGATVIRLERDYRSTPQVVAAANQVLAAATGEYAKLRLQLIGQRPDGPEPTIKNFSDEHAEATAVATRCRKLLDSGVKASELAVLFRVNAQSPAYEQALTDAGVPYVVRGVERFFERPEVREALVLLRGAARAQQDAPTLVEAVTEVLAVVGFAADAPPSGGASRERWEALAALVRLAQEFGSGSLREFADELADRANAQHAPVVEGVTLASLHAAKGLEWDAVFLIGLCEGTLPISHANTDEQLEEERRLLYVGVTRAREFLWMSWAGARNPGGRATRRPSRFLPASAHAAAPSAKKANSRTNEPRSRAIVTCRVCGVTVFDARQRKLRRCSGCHAHLDEALYEALRQWRGRVAKEQELPAYCILTDATLQAIAEAPPLSAESLSEIPGIGPRKLSLYGADVLEVIAENRASEGVAKSSY